MSAKVVSDFEPKHAVAQSHSLQNQVQKSAVFFTVVWWNRKHFVPTRRAFVTVVELRWGPRGPGPPERPGGPREISVLRGFKGGL